MLSSSGTSLNALLHRNVPQSRAPSTPRSIITTPRPFKSAARVGASHLLKLTSSSTREK
jgi:hypothetical protein